MPLLVLYSIHAVSYSHMHPLHSALLSQIHLQPNPTYLSGSSPSYRLAVLPMFDDQRHDCACFGSYLWSRNPCDSSSTVSQPWQNLMGEHLRGILLMHALLSLLALWSTQAFKVDLILMSAQHVRLRMPRVIDNQPFMASMSLGMLESMATAFFVMRKMSKQKTCVNRDKKNIVVVALEL